MAEGREQEIRSVAPDRANDVARLAGRGVRAFHKREVAIRCCAEAASRNLRGRDWGCSLRTSLVDYRCGIGGRVDVEHA